MATGTVTLHRVLRAPAERVYNAFLDRDAVARWLPPYGYLCQVHELDAKVGGKHRMTFRNFGTGTAIPLAAPIWSWCRTRSSATRISSMTPTWPARCGLASRCARCPAAPRSASCRKAYPR